MNQCILMGRLTRDPELKEFNSGTKVCNFAIAVDHFVKNGDKREKKASFFEMEAWDKRAESIAEFFQKGKPGIFVCSARQETWTDKASGGNRSRVKFIVNGWEFLPEGGKKDGEGRKEKKADRQEEAGDVGPAGDGDIPF